MSAVFLYSDPHFGHQGVCRFLRSDGTKLRPWDTAEEMDEHLVKVYNERVKPNDKIYFLGDVVINRKAMSTLARLNGDKVLIRGNHDIFRDDEYRQYFRELRAYHILNGLILSHIPIHEASLGRFGCSIHGHLHANRVMKARGVDAKTGEVLYGNEIDPRYFNVSVEQLPDFAPILFEDVCKRIVEQGGQIGFRNGNGPQTD
jgi:calcineurin-like phosphoesterase family protein